MRDAEAVYKMRRNAYSIRSTTVKTDDILDHWPAHIGSSTTLTPATGCGSTCVRVTVFLLVFHSVGRVQVSAG